VFTVLALFNVLRFSLAVLPMVSSCVMYRGMRASLLCVCVCVCVCVCACADRQVGLCMIVAEATFWC
jgi:hypothetical protein